MLMHYTKRTKRINIFMMSLWSGKAFWRGSFASTYKNKSSVVLLTRFVALLIAKFLVCVEISLSAYYFRVQHFMYLNLTDLNLEPHNRNMSNMISPPQGVEFASGRQSRKSLIAVSHWLCGYRRRFFSAFDRYFISKVTTKLNHLEHAVEP